MTSTARSGSAQAGTAVRRVGFGLSMILAPLLWLVSAALGPPHRVSKHLADELPHIAADPDRYLAATLIGVLSFALFVPAVLGVAHVLREQRPLLALSGAALAVVGILSSAVIHGVQFVQQQMIDVAADRGQMVALLQRTEAGIALKVILAGFILGLLLGWLILSAALFVTRVVPRAIPVLIVVSFMVNIVKPELGIVSRLFFLIGLGWLGVLVVRTQQDGQLSAEPTVGPSRKSA
ncbi:MAG: hypothetical protein H0U07_05465 [Actinobacteria bacterium]|nr:hypothetical protein [Actinomycetota bacterium]